jgi:hypothetical protein
MQISGIDATELVPSRRYTDTRQNATPATLALVAIDPPTPHGEVRGPMRHPAAPFIAQLIATRMRVPQTRDRRRAEPEVAIAAYREMMSRYG